MTRKAQQERRTRKLQRAEQRRRQLAYCAKQGGSWKLDEAELAELDSLVSMIERARQAQQQHERRVDVQLELAQVA